MYIVNSQVQYIDADNLINMYKLYFLINIINFLDISKAFQVQNEKIEFTNDDYLKFNIYT